MSDFGLADIRYAAFIRILRGVDEILSRGTDTQSMFHIEVVNSPRQQAVSIAIFSRNLKQVLTV